MLYCRNDPSQCDWSHLYIFFFSYLSCRVLRSIFLLVFLISPAGLKLQEVNRHFALDLFCPWGLWECLTIMSWPIFRNRVWFLRCPCLLPSKRKCPSSWAPAATQFVSISKCSGECAQSLQGVSNQRGGGRGCEQFPKGASTHMFEYSVRSGRAIGKLLQRTAWA